MAAAALESICWSDVVMLSWFLWCFAAQMACAFIPRGNMKRAHVLFSDSCLSPMTAVALGSIYRPEVVMWNWFQSCALLRICDL